MQQDYQPQLKSIILGLDDAGVKLWEKACLPIAALINDGPDMYYTKANYCELIKQIVDFLDPDPKRFFEYTKTLPNFDNLTGFAFIRQRPDIMQQIMEAVREFAVAFYFIATQHGLQHWPGELFCSYADRLCVQICLTPY